MTKRSVPVQPSDRVMQPVMAVAARTGPELTTAHSALLIMTYVLTSDQPQCPRHHCRPSTLCPLWCSVRIVVLIIVGLLSSCWAC